MFNALKYTEELEKAGFTRQQAEVTLKLLIDTMNENFATKFDLKEMELRLEARISGEVSRLDTRITSLESKFDSKFQSLESSMKEMEYKLTIKLGTLMTVAIGVTATLVKLLPATGH